MARQAEFLASAMVLLIALVRCGDDGNGQQCTPNDTQSCDCVGGTTGVQTCNMEGSGWSVCDCGGDGDGDADGDGDGDTDADSDADVGQTIGPSGGIVHGPQGVIMNIPEGALDVEVEFSITETTDTVSGVEPVGGVFEFLPHGTVFESPVTITVPYNETLVEGIESCVELWKSDSLDSGWAPLPSMVDRSANTVSGEITSLSYLTSWTYWAHPLGVSCNLSSTDPTTACREENCCGYGVEGPMIACGAAAEFDCRCEWDTGFVVTCRDIGTPDRHCHCEWRCPEDLDCGDGYVCCPLLWRGISYCARYCS